MTDIAFSPITGLSDAEATARLRNEGPNELPQAFPVAGSH